MKTVQLAIGVKGQEAVKVPLQKAETTEDMIALAKNSIEVVTRCFNRGWAIENQERSGARDIFREGLEKGTDRAALTTEIASAVSSYDPTIAAPRGGGKRGPRNVEVKAAAGGKLSMDDFLAQLKAQGINVNIAQ